MCGIAGIAGTQGGLAPLHSIKKMTDVIRHRGPDDEGFAFFEPGEDRVSFYGGADTPESVYGAGLAYTPTRPLAGRQHEGAMLALGHRRLSILDLSPAGHQPMCFHDSRYWIVYNGEIYNYLELREELIRSGYSFKTRSDTEVLLNAYVHWGAGCLNRLVGMFAFAIYDREKARLFLARDFFGIKPFYYTYWRHGFAFASEIKALLDLPGVSRRVNPQRLYEYLRFGLADHGGQTLFADVYQLPAAHYLEISLTHPDEARPVRYWQINLNQRLAVTFEEAAERVQELFFENVRLHLRSDVPVGAAFSGGIDSSAIVTAMRHLQGRDLVLHTFSYIADDVALSEEPWVDLMTEETGATAYKVRPQPRELVTDLDYLVYVQDEPFGSTSIYAQHRVFRLAQKMGIKVMLDGQGADELLGGYPSCAAARMASLIRQGNWLEALCFLRRTSRLPWVDGQRLFLGAGGLLVPTALQNPLRRLVGKDLASASLNTAWLIKHGVVLRSIRQRLGREVLRKYLCQTLVETSLPMLLRYEDRNSMAHSIESRVPFLTPALVDFVFALPEGYIIAPDGTSKAVFRKAMDGIVPAPILDRKDKIGFGTPEQGWLGTLRPWVEELLRSETAAQVPVLNLRVVEQDWRAVMNGRKPFDFRIWRWVNLIQWVERFAVSFEG